MGRGDSANLYEVHGAGESLCHHFGKARLAQGHVIHAIQVHPLPSLCGPNGIEPVPCAPCAAAQHLSQSLQHTAAAVTEESTWQHKVKHASHDSLHTSAWFEPCTVTKD